MLGGELTHLGYDVSTSTQICSTKPHPTHTQGITQSRIMKNEVFDFDDPLQLTGLRDDPLPLTVLCDHCHYH